MNNTIDKLNKWLEDVNTDIRNLRNAGINAELEKDKAEIMQKQISKEGYQLALIHAIQLLRKEVK